MAKKNEVAIVTETEKAIITNVLGGRMAQDIEFKQLDSALEKIAAHTGELSNEERQSAAELVTSFEDRVINALRIKQSTLNHFYSNLQVDPNICYHRAVNSVRDTNEQFRILFQGDETAYAGLEDMMNEFLDSVKKNEEYVMENEPEEPFIDKENMTPAEVAGEEMKYRMDLATFNTEMHRREFASRKLHRAFRKALAKNKAFVAFMKTLDNQKKTANTAVAITKEKASAAKMAILISNEEIREALRSFHEFAASI